MNKLDMLHTLSISELTELKLQIQQMIDLKHPGFKVGDKVTVDHPKTGDTIFTITKINRVKIKVVDSMGNKFKVSKQLLVPAPGATLKMMDLDIDHSNRMEAKYS